MNAEKFGHAPSGESSPESAERAAVIASFPSFLETQRKLKMEEIENDEELLAAYKDVTEYQFLITHYVVSESENGSLLKEMWHQLREIAKSKQEDFHGTRF
jgi:hypothetical protein